MIGVGLLPVTFSIMINEMKQIGFDFDIGFGFFMVSGFFALTLIGISIWVLLQTKKVIDFLFDLAEEKADISICFIVVFKNGSYDKNKGNENYRDYCQFINNVFSEKIRCNIDDAEVNKLTINNRKIYSVYLEIE